MYYVNHLLLQLCARVPDREFSQLPGFCTSFQSGDIGRTRFFPAKSRADSGASVHGFSTEDAKSTSAGSFG